MKYPAIFLIGLVDMSKKSLNENSVIHIIAIPRIQGKSSYTFMLYFVERCPKIPLSYQVGYNAVERCVYTNGHNIMINPVIIR